jgi:hypothetical protein
MNIFPLFIKKNPSVMIKFILKSDKNASTLKSKHNFKMDIQVWIQIY